MSIARRQSNAAKRVDSMTMGSPTASGQTSGDTDFSYAIPTVEAVVVDEYEKGDISKLKTANLRAPSIKSISSKALEDRSSHSTARWPQRLRDAVVESFVRPLNESAASKFLSSQDWPPGLQGALLKSCKKIPIRFFIIDDSGSMNKADGRKVLKVSQGHKIIDCTRWGELMGTVHFASELSSKLQAPSEFRLLNGADPVMIGLDATDDEEGIPFLEEVLGEDPAGQTPLCQHVTAVVEAITSMADELRQNGQRAAVIIATDGEATDGDVAKAMKPLQQLPVWVVIRLCTNEPKVVEYWNNIDKQLELEMDVIDDMVCDAQQVFEVNPWIIYGESIHRLREYGVLIKDMDLIDESQLSSEQMRNMCAYLFANGNFNKIPHPDGDFNEFYNSIKTHCNNQPRVYCPIRKTEHPWIDLQKLRQIYGPKNVQSSACTIS